MSETSAREKAKRLLAQGISKSEVADRCGISRRTVIRWSKEDDFIDAIANGANEQLIEESDAELATVAREVLGIEQRIADLLTYQNSQRDIAVATGDTAFDLLVICRSIINHLQQNPAEITPRMLPQLAKAASDLSKVSSDCWARTTGIEGRIRDEVASEIDARKKGFYLASGTNSQDFKELVLRYYPLKPGEEVRSRHEVEMDELLRRL